MGKAGIQAVGVPSVRLGGFRSEAKPGMSRSRNSTKRDASSGPSRRAALLVPSTVDRPVVMPAGAVMIPVFGLDHEVWGL